MESIANLPYSRNTWFILKQGGGFLSQDGTFSTVNKYEYDWMLEEMLIDNREAKAAAEGADETSRYHDNDTSWWDDPSKMFEDIDTDPEETRKQLLALEDDDTKSQLEERLKNIASTYEDADNRPSDTHKDEAIEQRNKNIMAMYAAIDSYREGNKNALSNYKSQIKKARNSQGEIDTRAVENNVIPEPTVDTTSNEESQESQKMSKRSRENAISLIDDLDFDFDLDDKDEEDDK